MELTDAHIIGAATIMAGAIAAIWRSHLTSVRTTTKVLENHTTHVKEELATCREGHEGTNARLLDLTEKLGKVEGRIQGEKEGVRQLSQQVLDQLHLYHNALASPDRRVSQPIVNAPHNPSLSDSSSSLGTGADIQSPSQ